MIIKPIKNNLEWTDKVRSFTLQLEDAIKAGVNNATLVKHEHNPNHIEYTLTGTCKLRNNSLKLVAHLKRDQFNQPKWFVTEDTGNLRPHNPFYQDMFKDVQ